MDELGGEPSPIGEYIEACYNIVQDDDKAVTAGCLARGIEHKMWEKMW